MKLKLLAILLLGSFYSLQSFALAGTSPICSELFERADDAPAYIGEKFLTPQTSFKEILRLVQSATSGSTVTMELTHLDADFVGSLLSQVILVKASQSNIQFRILLPERPKSTDITLLNVLAHHPNIQVRTLGKNEEHEITHNTFLLLRKDHSFDIILSNRDLTDGAYLSDTKAPLLALKKHDDSLLTASESNAVYDDGHKEFQIFNNVFWNNPSSVPVLSTIWAHNSLAGSNSYEGTIYRRAKLLARAIYRLDFNDNPSQEDGPSALVKKILERLP